MSLCGNRNLEKKLIIFEYFINYLKTKIDQYVTNYISRFYVLYIGK